MAFNLTYFYIKFSTNKGMPSTLQIMLAFQHLQASLKCYKIVLALLPLTVSGIISFMSLIIYDLSSKSKLLSTLCFVIVLASFLWCLPTNYLANKFPSHLSKMGIVPLIKNTQILHWGYQNPQPGPFVFISALKL